MPIDVPFALLGDSSAGSASTTPTQLSLASIVRRVGVHVFVESLAALLAEERVLVVSVSAARRTSFCEVGLALRCCQFFFFFC